MAACAAVPAMSAHAQTTGSGANANVVKSGVEAWQRQDYAGAVRQWETAAARGDADAEFNLGQAYRLGKGVPQDMAKAEFYFGRAARKGHPQAGDNYGIVLFQSGRQTEALPWLNTAADRGEPRAMYILGIAAFNGDYVGKDWVRAYALMTRAAANGLPQATASLATMDTVIPLEQRQMGISLAGDLERKAEQARSVQLAASDLGAKAPALQTPGSAAPRPLPTTSIPASTVATAPATPIPPRPAAPRPAPPPARGGPATGARTPRHRQLAHPVGRVLAARQCRCAVEPGEDPAGRGRPSPDRRSLRRRDTPARRRLRRTGGRGTGVRRPQGWWLGVPGDKAVRL